jgi:hypothetical protein
MRIGLGMSLASSGGVTLVLPGDISDLTATAQSDTEVLLGFTPADDADSHEYRIDGGSAVECDDNSGAQTITGLTAETEYDFEVRGVNGDGNGDWSNIATETTEAAPVAIAFGIDSGTGSSVGGAADQEHLYRFVAQATGTIDTLHMLSPSGVTASSSFRLTARSDTGGTALPSTLLAVTADQAETGSNVTYNLAVTPFAVVQGTAYWLGIHMSGACETVLTATASALKRGRMTDTFVGGTSSAASTYTALDTGNALRVWGTGEG